MDSAALPFDGDTAATNISIIGSYGGEKPVLKALNEALIESDVRAELSSYSSVKLTLRPGAPRLHLQGLTLYSLPILVEGGQPERSKMIFVSASTIFPVFREDFQRICLSKTR